MLKVAGHYVSPFEVEATLVQHAAVLEAAVVGNADDEGLTKTLAFVVLKAGTQATTRDPQGVRQGTAGTVQISARDPFVAELPKTATGKIQRFRLRERAAG